MAKRREIYDGGLHTRKASQRDVRRSDVLCGSSPGTVVEGVYCFGSFEGGSFEGRTSTFTFPVEEFKTKAFRTVRHKETGPWLIRFLIRSLRKKNKNIRAHYNAQTTPDLELWEPLGSVSGRCSNDSTPALEWLQGLKSLFSKTIKRESIIFYYSF